MIGYYNYTVILTYIGMISGFVGIAKISGGELKSALICLMVAGLCDMFDGRIASTMVRTKQEKCFGIQIDSLSDLVCFGVLPALIVFRCSDGKLIHLAICAVYLLCALIRLAWFNVDEEERQSSQDGPRVGYLGLPVTSAALIVPLFWGVRQALGVKTGPASPWLLLAVSAAFICPLRLRKPGLAAKLGIMVFGLAELASLLMGSLI